MTLRPRTMLIAVALALALAAPVVGMKLLAPKKPATPVGPIPQLPRVYGDGTASEAHNLHLAGIQLPKRAGHVGTVSVEILDQLGQPVKAMVRDHTKLVHLYVISADLTVFRHVMATYADGTWSGRVTLPEPGDYRVITEFTVDAGTHNDHLFLGGEWAVPGKRPAHRPRPMTSSDRSTQVAVAQTEKAVENGALALRVSNTAGHPMKLGRFLGSSAYVVAVSQATGVAARLDPIGRPTVDGDATIVRLRTGLQVRGPYVFFVQLHAKGSDHTLRAEGSLY